MRNTYKSMAVSCQCMAKKTLKHCKVISLQLIKIIAKTINKKIGSFFFIFAQVIVAYKNEN